jgi:hypothetical protein
MQPSVVVAALSLSFTRKSEISDAQARCLDLQTQQHESEMELLVIKKNNTIIQHKRKMEVLDAELEYWGTMNKSINTHKNNTRVETHVNNQPLSITYTMNIARILKAHSHSHSMSGGSIGASLECYCCF